MIEDSKSLQGGKAMLPEKPVFSIDLRLISLCGVDVTILGEVIALFIEVVQVVCELQLSAETIGLREGSVFLQRHPNGFLNLVIADFQVLQLS